MSVSRNFKGIWIPAEVWLDKSLSYFEKALLSEIHSLEGENGCFASNEYLCEFFNERERKIQEGISILKARGYIAIKSFDGRQRILITTLNPNNDKSLFSTSGVRNSAPLGCQNPHPSLYIDNKAYTTTKPPPKTPQKSKPRERVVAEAQSAYSVDPKPVPPKEKPKTVEEPSESVEVIKQFVAKCVDAELPFDQVILQRLALENYKLLRAAVKNYFERSEKERKKIKTPDAWLVDCFNKLRKIEEIF